MSGINLIDLSCVRTWPPPLLTRSACVRKREIRRQIEELYRVGKIFCVRAVGGHLS
jgi:hypothetical protein